MITVKVKGLNYDFVSQSHRKKEDLEIFSVEKLDNEKVVLSIGYNHVIISRQELFRAVNYVLDQQQQIDVYIEGEEDIDYEMIKSLAKTGNLPLPVKGEENEA